MPPRTIDNLGVDVSTRYAEDQKIFDESLIKEAQAISGRTGIEVTTPFLPADLAEILQLQPTRITWANFSAPPLYFEQRKPLFSYQLIPSMGSEDKQESQAQKILAKLQSIAEERGLKPREYKDRREQYEAGLAEEQEEKQKNVLTSLLNRITVLDKLIIEFNSKRNQYQKG